MIAKNISNNEIKEKCFYCENDAEYSQVVEDKTNYVIDYVCKKHLLMGLSS